MKKSHLFLLTVVIVGLAALSLLSISKYEHRPKGLTLNQAVSQRDDALRELQIVKASDQYKIQAAQKQATDLTQQKSVICQQVKAAKLVQPLCNQ